MRFSATHASVIVFGIASALVSHESLLGIATLRLGAPLYASHQHGSLGPVFFVEVALAILLATFGLRDALRQAPVTLRRPDREPNILIGAIAIATTASATLFGMEYVESGSAAFGYGWLGSEPMPGIVTLAIAIALSTAFYIIAVNGRVAAFERLAALILNIIDYIVVGSPQRRVVYRARPKLASRRGVPCARHGGLRAPPVTTL